MAKRVKSSFSVFVSYASEDRGKVTDLAFFLARDGFDPWMDHQKLLPGEDWELELRKAMDNCDVALACLSRASVGKRGYVQKEIRTVLETSKEVPEGMVFLIPVRIEECVVPAALMRHQWVDLFRVGGYEKLRRVLKRQAKRLAIRVRPARRTGDLTGVYSAKGVNWDGTPYTGTVMIAHLRGTYQLTWKIGGDRFEAHGVRHKNILTVTGDFDFSYSIRPNGSLFGKWEKNATETLVRIPRNASFPT